MLWMVTALAVGLLILGGLASYFVAPHLEPFHKPTRPIVPLAERQAQEEAEQAALEQQQLENPADGTQTASSD